MRALGLILIAVAGVFIFVPASLAQSRDMGRLYYEMTITNAGTRSQGWTGTLYDVDGAAVEIPPGETLETPIGSFAMHACTVPWSACGMIRDGSLPVDLTSLEALTDSLGWTFSLFVIAEGSRSQGWRGELRHGEETIAPSGGPVDTAMGRFVPAGEGDNLWDWSGWAPEGWLAP